MRDSCYLKIPHIPLLGILSWGLNVFEGENLYGWVLRYMLSYIAEHQCQTLVRSASERVRKRTETTDFFISKMMHLRMCWKIRSHELPSSQFLGSMDQDSPVPFPNFSFFFSGFRKRNAGHITCFVEDLFE